MENFEALKRIRDLAGDKPVVKSASGGYSPRQPKAPIKYGPTCQVCWEKKSLTGVCSCT